MEVEKAKKFFCFNNSNARINYTEVWKWSFLIFISYGTF